MAHPSLSAAQTAAIEALADNFEAPVRAGTLASLRRRGLIVRVQNGHELLSAGRDYLASLHPPAEELAGEDIATPTGLHERGTALWAQLVVTRILVDGNYAIAEEACRIADRLDTLDAALRGQDGVWLRIRLPRGEGGDLVLVVDSALAEARQQATVLRQLISALPVRSDDDDGDDDGAAFLEGLGVPT